MNFQKTDINFLSRSEIKVIDKSQSTISFKKISIQFSAEKIFLSEIKIIRFKNLQVINIIMFISFVVFDNINMKSTAIVWCDINDSIIRISESYFA